jgi:prophage regulatory protein
MALRLLRLPEVSVKLGLRTTAIYDRIKQGVLTPPVRLTARSRAWPEHEIDAIVGAHIAGDADDEIRALVQDLVAQRKQHSARRTHRDNRS